MSADNVKFSFTVARGECERQCELNFPGCSVTSGRAVTDAQLDSQVKQFVKIAVLPSVVGVVTDTLRGYEEDEGDHVRPRKRVRRTETESAA
jgi:hypothetical protein